MRTITIVLTGRGERHRRETSSRNHDCDKRACKAPDFSASSRRAYAMLDGVGRTGRSVFPGGHGLPNGHRRPDAAQSVLPDRRRSVLRAGAGIQTGPGSRRAERTGRRTNQRAAALTPGSKQTCRTPVRPWCAHTKQPRKHDLCRSSWAIFCRNAARREEGGRHPTWQASEVRHANRVACLRRHCPGLLAGRHDSLPAAAFSSRVAF